MVHYYFDNDEWELIDRKKDPMELTNVYDDPAYAEIRADLHKQLDDMREKYGDSSELSQEYIEKYLDYIQENNSYNGGKNTELIDKIFEERKK